MRTNSAADAADRGRLPQRESGSFALIPTCCLFGEQLFLQIASAGYSRLSPVKKRDLQHGLSVC
jgi:hypothetical protein